jgi:GH24 family phage-related lysozyme (muramidase)
VIHPRIAIGALAISAAAFVGLAVEEGYVETATIPTKNDRCTNGLGGTFNLDGSPVKCGDKIKPVPAMQRSLAHIAKDEAGLKRCVTAPLSQTEYDVLVDFAYQYGVIATCNSSIVVYANAGRYAESCQSYLRYKYSGGYDCSIPGNKVCSGVWKRNLSRRDKCLGAAA